MTGIQAKVAEELLKYRDRPMSKVVPFTDANGRPIELSENVFLDERGSKREPRGVVSELRKAVPHLFEEYPGLAAVDELAENLGSKPSTADGQDIHLGKETWGVIRSQTLPEVNALIDKIILAPKYFGSDVSDADAAKLNDFIGNIDEQYKWKQSDGTLFRGEDRELDEILRVIRPGKVLNKPPQGRRASPPTSYTTDFEVALTYAEPFSKETKSRINVIWKDGSTAVKSGVSINNVKDWHAGDSGHSEVIVKGDVRRKVLGMSLRHIVMGYDPSGVIIKTVLVVETEEE
jgi:hypothetical protein